MGGFGGVVKTSDFDLAQNDKQRIALGTEEIKKELLEKWKKENAGAQIFPASIDAMHPNVVDFLLEFARVADYDEIARAANLNQDQRNTLPHIVWQVTISKNYGDLQRMISENLAVNPAMTANITQHLEQKIIGKVKTLSAKPFVQRTASEPVKQDTSLPLAKALQEYPKLGEQNITSGMLTLKYFPEPVRPSIKNWITDYHDNMGAGKHEVMDRGNFLFHSTNAKTLTSGERQKLTMVLRALDDNTPVQIDPEKQALLFADMNQPTPAASPRTPAVEQPIQSVKPAVQEFKFNVQPAVKPAPAARPYVPTPQQAPTPTVRPNIATPIQSQSRPQYQQPAPPAPAKQNPVVNLKKQPENLQTAQEVRSHAAYPMQPEGIAQPVSTVPDAWKQSATMGGFSIIGARAEKNIPQEDELPARKPELHLRDEALGQSEKTGIEALVDNNAGVGSDNYFANFSSHHEAARQVTPEEKKEDMIKGGVAFAAPQQFPAEMAPQQPPIQSQPIQQPPVQHPQTPHPHVPYRITPMEDKYIEDDAAAPNNTDPKINGNVVDLKN